MNRPLEGRSALVTGANQGLGLAIARAYVQAGASVFLCARNATLLEQARSDVSALAGAGQRVLAGPADVSRQEDVDRVAAEAFARFPELDILVNNAGVYGPLGVIEDVDWTEWVQAIEINLFGSVLMCRAVLPHFKARRRGKIVQISGGGATNPLPRISAYAASKAGVIRFMETLAEEVREHGIDVNAIAPGPLNTRMLDQVLAAGPGPVGEAFYQRAMKQREEGGVSPEKGAELAVFLASSESDRITGKLLSAIWDPWHLLAAKRDDLRTSDVYTLRRIGPADRGFSWDKT